ncbi:hypothetical protein PIB30_061838 [Stylosanthes scabra]|uniref:Uncharacterized protein n=1 Tax=Stylosanthes scabra TaxID=79078 RepID=A0ABU6SME7_9FABA|nr:hypothetical protein [Stylosanthes scabra]
MMPLQFRPTTGNIILKEGAMVNLLVGSHLSINKLSLGSLIPTVSPRTAKIPDISLHIIDMYFRNLGIEKCLGKAKESIGSKGFMKRNQKGKNVASRVASLLLVAQATWNVAHAALMLHKQQLVEKQLLRTQHAVASSVACAANVVACATCTFAAPKLKVRIGISSLRA